ncbi:MAG: hydroxymethylpyrimidine/phosphomethylpyrimidine kinase [Acidobacteriota bacterium]
MVRSKANSVKHLPDSPTAPAVITIAGYDPSSGAGVTADLQVFAEYGVRGVSAVTALTVQARSGVRRVEPVNDVLLLETMELLAHEVGIAGVKIGMLATSKIARAVTKFLLEAGIPREKVVLDPVIRSSSGAELLDAEGVEVIREAMLPRIGWVTPNVAEAAVLAGFETIPAREQVPEVARRIQEQGAGLHVVVTGGHLEPPDDFLLEAGGRETWFPGRRVEARSVHGDHGTGCVFSSALACRLVLGDAPAEAVREAKNAVVRRLAGGAGGR